MNHNVLNHNVQDIQGEVKPESKVLIKQLPKISFNRTMLLRFQFIVVYIVIT